MEIVGRPPDGIAGTAYSFTFTGRGGTSPYTFTYDTLPSGWSLTSGVLAKASPTAQTFTVQITMSDSARNSPVVQSYTITIV